MGFWSFVGKTVISTVVAGSIIASGGATVPLLLATGATGYAAGKITKEIAKANDSEFWEWVGDTISDTGVGVFTGGVIGTDVIGKGSKSLASAFADNALKKGMRVASTNSCKVLINTWAYTKMVQCGYKVCGNGKKAWEALFNLLHNKHKEEGINYESECPVCNGNLDKIIYEFI
ncbi:10379_t:CDS:1 [Funneliformis geosporum]|uniref:10379_t:CDS:1 n=1 Tax=Funneliformis geosporum TaxID=1117311 RepID=A0A9W4T2H8_9GLOM|nr:10379_t:CDS:1 [Funneliformis geosporum]